MNRRPGRTGPSIRRRARRRAILAVALAATAAAAACGAPRSEHPDRAARSGERRATETSHPVTTLTYRYMTGLSDGTIAKRYGYNLVDVGPYPSLINALPPGVRALVWIGNYSHTTCSFTRSDADLRRVLAPLAHDPKVAGYYIDDEADYALPADGGHCPDVVAQVTARSALVHRLAPGAFTYEVVSDRSNYAAFAHATDVLGADAYPCIGDKPCDWNEIPHDIAALTAAHVTRYWGVLDAFGYEGWRWPTPAELTRMIRQWEHSRWQGEQTFVWNWRGSVLAHHPGLLHVLDNLNTGRLRPTGTTGATGGPPPAAASADRTDIHPDPSP